MMKRWVGSNKSSSPPHGGRKMFTGGPSQYPRHMNYSSRNLLKSKPGSHRRQSTSRVHSGGDRGEETANTPPQSSVRTETVRRPTFQQEIRIEKDRRKKEAWRNWKKIQNLVFVGATFKSVRKDALKHKIYGRETSWLTIVDDGDEEGDEMQHTWIDWLFPVMHPSSPFRRSWDMISLFVIVVSVFSTAFELGFDVEVTGSMAWVLNAMSIFFWLDLILNFLTSYTDDGELIEDRGLIAQKYLKSFFFIDVVSNLPYGEVAALSQGFWQNMRLVKGLRLLRIGRVLNRWGEAGYNSTMLHLFKLFLFILITGHLTACLWYYAAEYEGHGENNWTSMNAVAADTASLSSKYLASLYFAYTTLTTVGYGDISAHTNGERIVALFAVVAGSAVFAITISTMSAMAERSNHREEHYLHQLNNINDFMKTENLPKELRARVRLYCDYNYHRMDYTEMIRDLSPTLQNDIVYNLHRDIIERVPFLFGEPRDFVNAFIRKMHVVLAFEKELIVTARFVESHLHIVKSGIVEGLNSVGAVVKEFGVGSFFGESSALGSSRALMSYRARAMMELYLVSSEDVRELFKAFPKFEQTLRDVSEHRARHDKDILRKTKMAFRALQQESQELEVAAGTSGSHRGARMSVTLSNMGKVVVSNNPRPAPSSSRRSVVGGLSGRLKANSMEYKSSMLDMASLFNDIEERGEDSSSAFDSFVASGKVMTKVPKNKEGGGGAESSLSSSVSGGGGGGGGGGRSSAVHPPH